MQMDAEFKKEQNGTLFVPGGAVLGGGGSFWASRREFWHDVHYFFFLPSCLDSAKAALGK